MQLMDGVDVNRDLPSGKMGQAATERIDRKAFIGDGAIAGGEDIMVDPADKKCRLYGHVSGTEIQSDISLEAVFRL